MATHPRPRVSSDCGAAMLPRSRKSILSFALAAVLLAAGCASAPYTGRRQLLFSSEGSETRMGYQAFEQMKRQHRVSRDPELNALVTQVGRRVAAAAQRPDYRWEFVVLEGKEANAFCLPGGKVGIFTGLLKYTQDEAGLATVISHEVAHALARHAGERLSQSTLAKAGGLGLGVALGGLGVGGGQTIMQGYNLSTQLGILLPYSRTQESEADRVGLILMAKAGYDPAQALEFWRRMMAKDKGGKLPQFMSTHPNDATRLRDLQAFLPEARKYYIPALEAQSQPPPGRPTAPPQASAPAPPPAGTWVPAPR
jgi:predicted Zn-dependent protease